jgi:hypothetical protein
VFPIIFLFATTLRWIKDFAHGPVENPKRRIGEKGGLNVLWQKVDEVEDRPITYL